MFQKKRMLSIDNYDSFTENDYYPNTGTFGHFEKSKKCRTLLKALFCYIITFIIVFFQVNTYCLVLSFHL